MEINEISRAIDLRSSNFFFKTRRVADLTFILDFLASSFFTFFSFSAFSSTIAKEGKRKMSYGDRGKRRRTSTRSEIVEENSL